MRAAAAILGAAALSAAGCGTVDPAALERILAAGTLDDETIAAGLRQALEVGTERASARTSARDGFLGNPSIRIPLPDDLQTVATTLRGVGLGAQVDELEVAMNRAAEKAAGEAVDVFWGAIRSMTLSDVRTILHGHDTAATDFFRVRTGGELRTRFSPIVDAKLDEVGAVRAWDRVRDAYDAIPLTKPPAFDPVEYVTDEALDGLFSVLGEEEKRIREDPAARTTELLRKVFGASAS